MPLITLDPRTVLLVVDLQKGLAGAMPAPVFAMMPERSAALAMAFHARDLPVACVTGATAEVIALLEAP